MILIVDSDEVFGKCILRILKKNGLDGQMSNNAIDAMNLIGEVGVPEMVFLDVMLTGPDGFTFLNEMASYADTAKVPVVIVSERDFSAFDLRDYNVVGFLNKNTMKPEDVLGYVQKYVKIDNVGKESGVKNV